MLAISLWQPWASLWAAGVKVHETRHWRCDDQLGQAIAIHAAKKLITRAGLDPLCAAICNRCLGSDWERTLPRGALIGRGKIVACWRTAARRDQVSADERALGDWSDGRYAWQLAEVAAYATPIPYIGRQKWFAVSLAGVVPAPAQARAP